MPELRELNALWFLRNAIHAPEGEMDDGRIDMGWCCSEHAMIASLAFPLCGIKTLYCKGRIFAGPSGDLIHDVEPHWFAIVAGNGVFDSSITVGTVSRGLPCAFKKLYHNLAVCGGEKIPTKDEFLEKWRGTRKKTLLWYCSSEMKWLTSKALAYESTTPFGEWLTERYGSQDGIWGKVAWLTAEILKGKAAPTTSNKDAIWDIIASTPNRNNEVGAACDALLDKRAGEG